MIAPAGLRLAQVAGIVGLLFAAVSLYWGVGGTKLLDTVGGSFEEQGRAGNLGFLVAAWAAALLKTVAAVLPLMALRRRTRSTWDRTVWVLAWAEAAVLTLYGLTYTTVGLLIQSEVIRVPDDADRRGLAWHAYLWDPWFIVWGVLVLAALLHGRSARGRLAAPPHNDGRANKSSNS